MVRKDGRQSVKKFLICMAMFTTVATAEPEDPIKKDAFDSVVNAIGENLLQPLTQDFQDRIMRGLAEKDGALSKQANKHLESRKMEEQIAYDDELKRKQAAIMEERRCKIDCKPRPISECMKPNFTLDDEVLGCSEGKIVKYWE
jgi:phosphopantothenoylcysteine synthetase/decarboxylase